MAIVDPFISVDTFLLGMFPVAKGPYLFNGADEQEWQIGRDTDVTFVVYGMFRRFQPLYVILFCLSLIPFL